MRFRVFIYICALMIQFIVLALLFTQSVFAQKTKPSSKEPDFRQIAVLTLETSLDETRKIEDLSVRIALTEKIVKLIKDSSTEDCKRAIDRLYDSVIEAKKLSKNKESDDFESQISGVIKIASIIDAKLAEKYIEKYEFQLKSELKENNADLDDQSKALIYLAIAVQLLETNPRLSVDVAEVSTRIGLFIETLEYLVKLKEINPSLSETFFGKALANVKSRNAKDINEVFILYAFVFNKSAVPYVNSGNLASFPTRYFNNQLQINPNLARNFIQTSLQLLSNQERTTAGSSFQTTHGALGDYFFLKVVEPLARQYAGDLQGNINSLQTMLYNFLDQENRSAIDSSIDSWNSTKNSSSNTKKGKDYWLEKAEKTENASLKDSYFYEAAKITNKEEDFDETLKIAGLIKDDAMNGYVVYEVGKKLIDKKEFEKVEEIIKKDTDVTRKVSLYVYLAKKHLEDKNFPLVNQNLAEADLLLKSLDNKEKSVAQFAIASIYAGFDETKAIQIWNEGLDTANKVASFTNKINISRNFMLKNFANFYRLFDDQMKTVSFLPKLSTKNFINLITNVSSIQNTAFKIENQIAICSPIIKPKK